eukprot:Skav230484  [mRNA]  locus=scaffold1445:339038:342656:- [translate_table: standard]
MRAAQRSSTGDGIILGLEAGGGVESMVLVSDLSSTASHKLHRRFRLLQATHWSSDEVNALAEWPNDIAKVSPWQSQPPSDASHPTADLRPGDSLEAFSSSTARIPGDQNVNHCQGIGPLSQVLSLVATELRWISEKSGQCHYHQKGCGQVFRAWPKNTINIKEHVRNESYLDGQGMLERY